MLQELASSVFGAVFVVVFVVVVVVVIIAVVVVDDFLSLFVTYRLTWLITYPAAVTEGVDYSVLDAKDPESLTEEEKIALLGRPCLGTNPKIQIRIKESKEFKVSQE